MYNPIACEYHDYIEVACMRGYTLRLALLDGKTVVGQAQTTETAKDKTENLLLNNNGEVLRIRLDQIISIEPMDENASFGLIQLRPS